MLDEDHIGRLFFDDDLVAAIGEFSATLKLRPQEGACLLWHFEDGTSGIMVWLKDPERAEELNIPAEYKGYPVQVEKMPNMRAAAIGTEF